MKQLVLQVALTTFALLGVPSAASAAEAPMPDAYDGAELLFSIDHEDSFIEIALGPIVRRSRAVGNSTHKIVGMRGYFGGVARRHYRIDDAVSTSEVHSHYAAWLAAHGFTVLLDSRGDSPMAPGGTSWALRAYGELPTEIATELSGTRDKNRRLYIVAESLSADDHTVVAVLINPRRTGALRVQVDVVSVDVGRTSQAFPSRAQLYERLASDGSASLRGLQFIGQKSVPRDSCDLVLAELAAVLEEHPDMRLKLVGRVTMEGRDDTAAALSLARATRVLELLVMEHGIDAGRLEAVAADVSTQPAEAPNELDADAVQADDSVAVDGISVVVLR